MNSLQKTIKQLLRENLAEVVSIRVFALPVGVFLIFLINKPTQAIEIFIEVIKQPISWVIWIAASVGDAFIRAIYWYFRLRNPRYIKKQEEFERWKAEKAAAKKKDESGGGGSV